MATTITIERTEHSFAVFREHDDGSNQIASFPVDQFGNAKTFAERIAKNEGIALVVRDDDTTVEDESECDHQWIRFGGNANNPGCFENTNGVLVFKEKCSACGAVRSKGVDYTRHRPENDFDWKID